MTKLPNEKYALEYCISHGLYRGCICEYLYGQFLESKKGDGPYSAMLGVNTGGEGSIHNGKQFQSKVELGYDFIKELFRPYIRDKNLDTLLEEI